MKTRESGMPPEDLWRTFFSPGEILLRLGLTRECRCAVDLGCGYGTFTVPAARAIRGVVQAFDIDPAMVARTRAAAAAAGLSNVQVVERDFVEQGTGLPDASADFVMLFNLLHAAEARELVLEARRILQPEGLLAVVHWQVDPATPRGPSLEIRVTPEHCLALAASCGFAAGRAMELPPYHWGFAVRPAS